MRRFFCSSIVVLGISAAGALAATDTPTPSALFIESIASIDTLPDELSRHAPKSAASTTSVDSIARVILDRTPVIQGIFLIDGSGAVVSTFNRTRKSVAMGNVALKEWFVAAKTDRIPVFGGVVRADDRYCFLKSYPFALTSGKKSSDGVLVVLVDATRFLDQIRLEFGQPFTVTYKSVPFYRSSAETTDMPAHATMSGYADLAIDYGARVPAVTAATRRSFTTALFSTPLAFAFLAGTLLLCILSYFFGRQSQKQSNYKKFLEMEYEKISKEQQKEIHDRALSQVYCEIKRQIETHELKKIEDEIRQKIGLDIEARILVN
jgi:hypothetical protein